MCLANNKTLPKIYAEFSIADCTKKTKNDQVMGNRGGSRDDPGWSA